MKHLSLEDRVAALEKQMAAVQTEQANGPAKNAWRETIGMFTNDPDMLEIFNEAMKIREADRQKACQRQKKKRQRARS